MRYRLTATGPLSPEAVWERYAVPSEWSSWSPQIRWVDLPSDRIAAGQHGVVHGHLGVEVAVEILAVDEAARTWTWRASWGPATMTLHHTVEASTAGTRTTLEVTGPAYAVLSYAPLAQVAIDRLVRP